MRTARFLIAFFVLVSTAFAAGLKLRVTDPQSAVVGGARYIVTSPGGHVAASGASAADGSINIDVPPGNYTVHVLAPGFAPAEVKVMVPSELVLVKLQVASASENVVVTATATPVAASETGVADYSLDGKQIELFNAVSAAEVIRYLPGAYVANNGRMGGLSTLFVRGGETRYNKVIVDGVPVTVNDAGGVFNFGVVPMDQLSHVELQRGANSTLYGSDAMTSVVQMWSAQGTTAVPELKFGADGGSFDTANGYASLGGARGRFDYNVFGDEFHTDGQGINDTYGNSMQGVNLGAKLSDKVSLRARVRHSNSRTGTPGAWDFGSVKFPPDSDQYARENDLLGSAVLSVAFTKNFQSTFTGFEYSHHRRNVDTVTDNGRPYDDPFDSHGKFNNAGFEAQSEYTPRSWARTVFGYRFEDESGSLTDVYTSFGFPGSSEAKGLRRNHAVYGEQLITWQRLSAVAGVRYEHNEVFGGKTVPRVSASYLVSRGRGVFSGTRLRAAYSEGFKAPTFDQQFGEAGSYPILPNPDLKPEQTRSWEAGFIQDIANGKYSVAGTYFHNDFTNLINYITADPVTFVGQYINLNKSLAHGAEVELDARLAQRLTVTGSYVYTSSQALVANPCSNPSCTGPGQELFRRPKQLGQMLVTWISPRWGASVTGSFVGRRRDSDFYMISSPDTPVSSVAGYARVDASAWRTLNHYVTAYASIYNLLNNHYQETAGYPALHTGIRAGFRFRVGGE